MLGNTRGNKLNEHLINYVVYDLETTGISPMKDSVVEISAVKVQEGKVVSEFTTLVNPERKIPWAASKVNGITDDMVKDAPVFEQAFSEFLEFVQDYPLVGHNITSFDNKFLYRYADCYWNQTVTNDYLDTLYFARRVLKDLKHHRLTDLAEYYGISTEGAHRALQDCRMNQQIYERLCCADESTSSDVKF